MDDKINKIHLGLVIASLFGFFMALLGYLGGEQMSLEDALNGPDAWWILIIIAVVLIWLVILLVNIVGAKILKISTIKFLKYLHNIFAFTLCLTLILGGVGYGILGTSSYISHLDLINDPSKAPYLTWTAESNTTITITWETTNLEDTTFSIGTDPDNLNSIVTTGSETHHEIRLSELTSSTRYYYKVNGFIDTYSFTTMADPNSNPVVKFIVYGDNRFDSNKMVGLGADDCHHNEIVAKISELYSNNGEYGDLDYNFTFNVGDVVLRGGNDIQWTQFHREIAPLATTRPYMITFGNHEYYGGNDQWTEFDALNARKYWTFNNDSGDEMNYYFSVGKVLFVVFGSGQYGNVTEETADWVNQTLSDNAANYDWVFTSSHHPLYSHGRKYSNLTSMLEADMHNNGVDVHLAGHVHDYQRLVDTSKNWTHIVTGGGGANVGHPNTEDPTVNVTAGIYHFMEWTIEGNHAMVRTILENGTVFESFELWT